MEKEILARLRHPYISNIYFAFQDKENLYLAVELAWGVDLEYYLEWIKKKFKEE